MRRRLKINQENSVSGYGGIIRPEEFRSSSNAKSPLLGSDSESQSSEDHIAGIFSYSQEAYLSLVVSASCAGRARYEDYLPINTDD